MPQIFHRSTNTFSKVSIFGAVFFLGFLLWLFGAWSRSSWATQAGVAREQPIPFSHAHHVGDEGIDCRYCHTSVETSAFANIPPTKTCMNCHAQIWNTAPTLEPVGESLPPDRPSPWTRVHDLPDFAYFNHSIHINKGVGCETCHGRVDQMPVVSQANSLQMEWGLECHRRPENFVRPKEKVFDMEWRPPADQKKKGLELVKTYHIQGADVLTSCSTCHR